MKYVLLVIESNSIWEELSAWEKTKINLSMLPFVKNMKLCYEDIALCNGDVLKIVYAPLRLAKKTKFANTIERMKNDFDLIFEPQMWSGLFNADAQMYKDLLKLAFSNDIINEICAKYINNNTDLHIGVSADKDSPYLRELFGELQYLGRYFTLFVKERSDSLTQFIEDFIVENGVEIVMPEGKKNKLNCDIVVDISANNEYTTKRSTKIVKLLGGGNKNTRRLVVEGLVFDGLKPNQYDANDFKVIDRLCDQLGTNVFVTFVAFLSLDINMQQELMSILNLGETNQILNHCELINAMKAALNQSNVKFAKCTF